MCPRYPERHVLRQNGNLVPVRVEHGLARHLPGEGDVRGRGRRAVDDEREAAGTVAPVADTPRIVVSPARPETRMAADRVVELARDHQVGDPNPQVIDLLP